MVKKFEAGKSTYTVVFRKNSIEVVDEEPNEG